MCVLCVAVTGQIVSESFADKRHMYVDVWAGGGLLLSFHRVYTIRIAVTRAVYFLFGRPSS